MEEAARGGVELTLHDDAHTVFLVELIDLCLEGTEDHEGQLAPFAAQLLEHAVGELLRLCEEAGLVLGGEGELYHIAERRVGELAADRYLTLVEFVVVLQAGEPDDLVFW